jgi:uncharacterized phage-like protein YoqJ
MVSLQPPTLPPPEVPKPAPLVVAVTGHRPDKLGGYKVPNEMYDLVVAGVVTAFEAYKPAYVLTGMALGVDQWSAEICLNMNIPFVAAVPFDDQDKIWPPHSKAKYQWLLSKAYQVTKVSQGAYSPQKMQARNQWMVNSSHLVIAVWNGTKGGTANCVEYAVGVGKKIHYVPLPPSGMSVGDFFNQVYGAQPKQEAPKTDLPNTGKRIVEI